MSKTYNTWQVVKALTEHAGWRAECPDDSLPESMESLPDGSGIKVGFFSGSRHIGHDAFSTKPDWRLYDQNGNEVTDYE